MRSDRVFAPVALVGLLFVGSATAVAQQIPAAPAEAAPSPAAAPRPAGGLPVTPARGDGPWDFATEKGRIHVTVVTKDLDHPWGMAFLPDGAVLVTERPGRLRVVRAASVTASTDRG
jgi:glucose/arabinose dehydrogenase